MENLEKKKYYKPIYCYRRYPMNSDIYEHIIEDLLKHKKITLYENINKAKAVGLSQLIDDDCYEIAIFDFTQGFCKIYYDREHNAPHNTIAYLDCYSKCYEIIQTEVKS